MASDILYPASTLIIAVLALIGNRFGRGSWLLSLSLAFPAVGFGVAGVLRSGPTTDLADGIAFATLCLAMPAVVAFLWTVDRANYLQTLRERTTALVLLCLPAPILLYALFWFRPPLDSTGLAAARLVALGPGGYGCALYLLAVSVVGLASMEQILRGVDERVRWELKFLILGLATMAASVIFVSSRILLYPYQLAFLSADSLLVFPIMSLLSNALIFLSWRRASGSTTISVSQRLVYSSITLLGVGIYLIVSSLLARWAGQWALPGGETQVIVFLVSAVLLASALLWTGFRHRVRHWLHRNIFAGRYDYRHYWIEASEKVRTLENPESAARALAAITHGALGAIDVSVWLRERKPNRLSLLAFRGEHPDTPDTVVRGIVEKLVDYSEPIDEKHPAAAGGEVRDFMRQAHSALLVPLVSSGRLTAVLAVGPDRSGRPFDHEAREFLKVLGGHAAAEFHKADLLSTLVETKESEAFRTFSTFLLHDLKNFASTLSLIAKNAPRFQGNPEFQRDAFSSVFETAEKMRRLCNSLKTFSGNLALNMRKQDLNEIVREVADTMAGGLGGSVRLELGQLPSVLVDPDEIGRLIQNLLMNAREAIPEGGRIVVRTRRVNGRVELSVQDNGRGMTAEFLEKGLFHPFRTTKSDGLGIGLFQCKKIAEAHGGTVEVQSESGKGTTVRMLLPCSIDRDPSG